MCTHNVDRPVANLTLCQKGVHFAGIKLHSSLTFKIKWLFTNSKQLKITLKEFCMNDFFYASVQSVCTRKWLTDYNQGQTLNSVHIFMLYICVYTVTCARVYLCIDKLLYRHRYALIHFVYCTMFLVICSLTWIRSVSFKVCFILSFFLTQITRVCVMHIFVSAYISVWPSISDKKRWPNSQSWSLFGLYQNSFPSQYDK